MGDEVLHAEECDRRRPRQHGVGRVAAAAERDGDPVGTALALELFEVERQRKRRGGIAQGSRLRLGERHSSSTVFTLSAALTTSACVLKNKLTIGSKSLAGSKESFL